MQVDALKLRLMSFVKRTIDLYLPCTNVINKLGNATAKLYIEQHIGTLDKILNEFADENGEIDGNVVARSYEDALFGDSGELQVNIKELLSDKMNSSVVAFLPERIILFHKEDLRKIFE